MEVKKSLKPVNYTNAINFLECRASDVYNGKVIYGKDAFTDLRFMDAYISAKKSQRWSDISGFLDMECNI